jgi:hypothetical protein
VLYDAESYFADLRSENSSPARAGRFADLPHGRPDLMRTDEGLTRRAEIFHFLLRSAVVLTEGVADDLERLIDENASLFQEADLLARAVTYDPAVLHAPPWVDLVIHNLRDSATAAPAIERIDVRTTLDLRLYARSFTSADRIEVSAVTYEHLRSMNLLLWNLLLIFEEEGGWEKMRAWGGPRVPGLLPVPPAFLTDAASTLLPLLASLSRDMSPRRLPMLRAHSVRAFRCAKATTEIQLAFLLAHEYAHTELHRGETGRAERMAREIEADRFAFEVVQNYRGMRGQFDFGDIWTAVHWLFHVLATESTLAVVLARSDVSPRNAVFDARLRRIEDYRKPFDVRDAAATLFGTSLLTLVRDLFVRDRAGVADLAGRYETQFPMGGFRAR